MPSIQVTTPKLTEEKANELAKRIQEAIYPVLNNREIFVFINEPRYYVNGNPVDGGYINVKLDAANLSEEKLNEAVKVLYEAATAVLGELRFIFSYTNTPLDHVGVNGYMINEYLRLKAEGKLQ